MPRLETPPTIRRNMISFDCYTDDELKNASKVLKAKIKPSDFTVLEQIERIARKRGLDPAGSDFGPDVIGDVIKKMLNA